MSSPSPPFPPGHSSPQGPPVIRSSTPPHATHDTHGTSPLWIKTVLSGMGKNGSNHNPLLSSSFILHTHDSHTLFLPGQWVEGYLSFSLSSPLLVHSIRAQYYGLVTSRHPSSSSAGGAFRKDHKDRYGPLCLSIFKEHNLLYQHPGRNHPHQGVELIMLPAGDHLFPFSFRTPPLALPPSFQGSFGKVEYFIRASLFATPPTNPFGTFMDGAFMAEVKEMATTQISIAIPSVLNVDSSSFEQSAVSACHPPIPSTHALFASLYSSSPSSSSHLMPRPYCDTSSLSASFSTLSSSSTFGSQRQVVNQSMMNGIVVAWDAGSADSEGGSAPLAWGASRSSSSSLTSLTSLSSVTSFSSSSSTERQKQWWCNLLSALRITPAKEGVGVLARAYLSTNGFTPDQVVPVLIELVNGTDKPVAIASVSLKQKVLYSELSKWRTEKVFQLPYSEIFPASSSPTPITNLSKREGVVKYQRLLHFPLPGSDRLSASFSTPILKVRHELVIQLVHCLASPGQDGGSATAAPMVCKGRTKRRVGKLTLPVTIGGFPCTLWDLYANREVIEPLPVYMTSAPLLF